MKRVFSLLLTLFLAMVLLPVNTEAVTVVDSGKCGENVTWVLDDKGTLTISGTGEMEDYYGNGDTPWYSSIDSITSVVIQNGVTSIGVGAFADCSNLTSVTIPAGVTSIGVGAFADCSNLTSITIPESVTSIGMYAFQDCDNLTSVNIPDRVTGIGDYVFLGCSSLTSITIPENVSSIGDYAFWECTGLKSVSIPESVTSIGYGAFAYCKSLASVSLPQSFTSIGDYAFYACDSLTFVTIPSGVTNIGEGVFAYCGNLNNVIFSGNAPTIDANAFYESTVTAYYPADNSTWTTVGVRQDYGGTITWVPYNADFSSVKPTISVAKNTYNSLKVTWSAVKDAKYYEVYRSTSPNSGFVKLGTYDSETFSKISGSLATGTKYYYKVRAYRVVDGYKKYSAYSDVISGTPTLSAPATVTVAKNNYNSLKISWTKVEGASFYQVYRSEKGANNWKLLGTYDENTFSMTSRQLSTGTTYEYRVRCYRWAGGERQFSGYSAVKSGTPTLSAPTGVKAVTGTTKGTVKVSWNKVDGATYYQVYRSANGTSDWKLLGVYDANTLSMTSKALGSGQSYYYRVRCYRWAGGERQFSTWSTIVSAVAK